MTPTSADSRVKLGPSVGPGDEDGGGGHGDAAGAVVGAAGGGAEIESRAARAVPSTRLALRPAILGTRRSRSRRARASAARSEVVRLTSRQRTRTRLRPPRRACTAGLGHLCALEAVELSGGALGGCGYALPHGKTHRRAFWTVAGPKATRPAARGNGLGSSSAPASAPSGRTGAGSGRTVQQQRGRHRAPDASSLVRY